MWRATDTSLGRDVAVKLLPANVAGDAERLARFEREARLLASLNHPNIAAVYGLHEQAGTRFIAMELVAGRDLAEQLSGGALPPKVALEIAGQIVDALEAAHDAGVIHRDLKPANIHITPEGKVKVLDFGLAREVLSGTASADPHLSPTRTSAGTQLGVVLGTAAYMSPEQARGQIADRRADVWGFGAVLYQMLTGTTPFRGPTVSDTMAAVLKVEPDWSLLPPETPAAVRRLLRRCLRKDPQRRLHDIADARIELEDANEETESEPEAIALAAPSPRRSWSLGLAGLAVGLIAGVALYAWLVPDGARSDAGAGKPRRSLVPLHGPGPMFDDGLALSPDGSVLVFTRGPEPDPMLYLRSLDSLEVTPIPGTEGGFAPFFSPDGEWVGFFDGDELRKLSIRGGESAVVGEANVGSGGTWSEDGFIYFTHGESRMARVPAAGGEPEQLFEESAYRPHALPGGRGVVVTLDLAGTASNRKDAATIAHVSADGKTVTHLVEGGYNAKVTRSGHLVFMRQGALFAAPFDDELLQVTGPAVRLVPNVWTDSVWATARYDVAGDGTLVYVPGGDYARTIPTWIDRQGDTEPLSIPREVHGTFQLSPDRSTLALQVAGTQNQIYVHDLARDTFTRLTFEGANMYPAWSHDGEEVFYASYRDGKVNLVRRRVDGTEQPLLTESQRERLDATFVWPYSASPDGKHLLVGTWGNLQRGGDIYLLRLDGNNDPQPLVATEDNEIIPMFSPDGGYICYLSNKAGPYAIYVRPFPDVDRREWPISNGPGYDARWSPAGDEILYRVGDMQLVSVPYTLKPEFTPGSPRLVLETDFHDSAGFSFDLSGDGERILVNRPEMSLRDELTAVLVTDWFVELDRATARP